MAVAGGVRFTRRREAGGAVYLYGRLSLCGGENISAYVRLVEVRHKYELDVIFCEDFVRNGRVQREGEIASSALSTDLFF